MGKIGRKIAAGAAAAMLVSSSVSAAAPADELKEIMEKQEALQTESLVAEMLDFEGLSKSFEENGMQIGAQIGMTDGTVQTIGAEGEVPEDGYVSMNLQIDQKLKKWLFGMGFGAGTTPFLDYSFYGDTQQFAVSVPQFYAGALGIRAGSFLDQFNGSALKQLLEQAMEQELQLEDIDLKFFPEEGNCVLSGTDTELWKQISDNLDQRTEALEQNMRVEKSEESGKIKYTAYLETEDVMNLYLMIFDAYMDIFEEYDLVSQDELAETEDELNDIISQMKDAMGEEVAVCFYADEGLIEKISCDMYIDTTLLEADAYDNESAKVQDNGSESSIDSGYPDSDQNAYVDVELTSNPFKGEITYEITFENPQQPDQAVRIRMGANDTVSGENMAIEVEKQTAVTGTSSETSVDLTVWGNDELLYSDELLHSLFNADTGELDAVFTVQDENSGSVSLILDSVISKTDTGFVWTIDHLAAEADGESAGLCGEVAVSGVPGEIETPQNVRMLLEMDQGGLMGLLTEISVNAENWQASLEPEEDEYGEDTSSVAIIGGADGPTSVFLAGKVG